MGNKTDSLFYTMRLTHNEEFLRLKVDCDQFSNRFAVYGIITGNTKIEKPVVMSIDDEFGGKFSNIITTNSAIYFVISDALHLDLVKNGVSGLSYYQLDCPDCVQRFMGVVIKGRLNAVPDLTTSELINGSNGRPMFYKGLFFNMETWDGSDVFYFVNEDGSIDTRFLLLSALAYHIIQKYESAAFELRSMSETRHVILPKLSE